MSYCMHNFNPGPAALPRPVLDQAQRDLRDFEGTGISILETSHRSAVYERLHNEAIADLRALLECPEAYAILFIGGGAQTHFALVPMQLLSAGRHAAYLITGHWSEVLCAKPENLVIPVSSGPVLRAGTTVSLPLETSELSLTRCTCTTRATTPLSARSFTMSLTLARCHWYAI